MRRGAFLFRAEHRDWDFLARLGEQRPFDAAIICDRYLSEYPEDDEQRTQPDRLARAFADRDIAWVLDPETARLAHNSSQGHQSRRAALRAQARALPLPITPQILADTDHLDALIEAAAPQQLSSTSFAVPYFECESLEDPYLAVNLALIQRARAIAGDRELVAYLQVRQSVINSGIAQQLLQRFVGAGAQTVVIRARRLAPERASVQEALAYARLVKFAADRNIKVIADCASRLGPVLVAAGAHAFSAGAYHFRTIPQELHPKSGSGGGSEPLMWELPGGGASTLGRTSARSCAVTNCPVPNSKDAADDSRGRHAVRVHNCHNFQAAGQEAARLGLAYSDVLTRSADPVVRGWAAALQALQRRAA